MKNATSLTRLKLSRAVYRELGLSQSESSDLVERVLEEIIQALLDERGVKLSSFGAFSLHHRAAAIGRNPLTGKETTIPAGHIVKFTPSTILKRHVNIHAKRPETAQ